MTSEEPNITPTLLASPPQQRRKPGPWRINDIIDCRALGIKLSAIAMDNLGDPAAKRKAALDALHSALFRGRMIAQERLQQRVDGLDTARLLAAVQDEVLRALFEFISNHVEFDGTPFDGTRMAVIATGGYGRGVLAPSSDIDLLFIHDEKKSDWAERVIEYMLYMLWDMGLKVGHAYRTVSECIRLAKTDVTIKTSLLDARFLFGDAALADQMIERFERDVCRGTDKQFIADKLAERDQRHRRQGSTSYVVEPNLKDGMGGLRDLQTLYWITKHVHGGATLEDVMHSSVFTEHEYAVFIRSARFFWTVRCHLHFLTGRAEERISFDLQPELAKRLGYRDRGDQLGVERFMKRYFLAAKDVGSLSRILSAKIALEQEHKSTGPIVGFLSGNQARPIEDQPGFLIEDKQISFAPSAQTRQHPELLAKLFLLSDQMERPIHPAALSRVTREIRSLKPAFRERPAVIDMFLACLLETRHPADVLRLMNEAGLLGRLVPEFGGIVAQTQFNMYHHYTVDEHTIRTIESMADLEHSRTDISPLATRQFAEIDNRRALYLAMLLHDTGKGKGDQQLEGMLTARRACKRLGLPAAEVELVAWLVGNHLEMSEIAQKRDIADPRTVTDFAHLVGGIERLRLLYILTISDINGVGPQVWNSWKGQLLAELFNSTVMALRGGRADEERFAAQLEDRAEDARSALIEQRGTIPTLMLEMEPAYWTGFDTYLLTEQADMISDGAASAVKARPGRKRDATTLTIITADKMGMFARVAGFLAREGANIVSAQVYSSKSGSVINVYRLQGRDGRGFRADDPDRIEKFETDLLEVLSSDSPLPEFKPRRNRRESAFVVQPSVKILNDASRDHTVIDIAGRDRPGLLYEIAQTIVDHNLNVASAHVGSYGERVFDAFYVQTLKGGKILDEAVKTALKEHLLAVLRRYEPEGPETPAHKLARAKAKDSF